MQDVEDEPLFCERVAGLDIATVVRSTGPFWAGRAGPDLGGFVQLAVEPARFQQEERRLPVVRGYPGFKPD